MICHCPVKKLMEKKKEKKRKFNYIYVLCVIAEGKIKTHFFRDLTYPK